MVGMAASAQSRYTIEKRHERREQALRTSQVVAAQLMAVGFLSGAIVYTQPSDNTFASLDKAVWAMVTISVGTLTTTNVAIRKWRLERYRRRYNIR